MQALLCHRRSVCVCVVCACHRAEGIIMMPSKGSGSGIYGRDAEGDLGG